MSNPTAGMSPGLARQMEIYRAGLAGKTPEQPISIEELESEAQVRAELRGVRLPGRRGRVRKRPSARNREAFLRWRLVPRYLRDVSSRDLGVEVLGQRLPVPVLLAPIGVMSIFHQEAEPAVARAAAPLGVPMILSTVSSTPMEQVAQVMGDAPRWFQLYWPASDELAASFVGRAERAGFTAIVVTVDTYLLAWRSATSATPTSPSCAAGAGQLLQRPGLPASGRRRSADRPGAHVRVLRAGLLRPLAAPGPTSNVSARRPDCRSSSRACSTPRMPGRPSTTAHRA